MAIVTGAVRGIGLATARLFVNQGYQVAMETRLMQRQRRLLAARLFVVMCLTLWLLTKWSQQC